MAVVLYGATGFTGRRTARALAENGLELVVAGRDAGRVAALAGDLGCQAAVAAPEPRALRRAFAGAEVVLSCAGPFARVGRPVAEAAIAAGAHYVDSTGEAGFMRWVYEELDGAARAAGRAAIPAGGFDYLPADCAASLLERRLGPLREIDYVYTAGGPASAGTRRSIAGVLRDDALVVREGRLTTTRPFRSRRGDALLSPQGDPLCAARRLGVTRAEAWTQLPRGRRISLRLVAPLLAPALRGPLGTLAERLLAGAGGAPSAAALAEARWTVRVDAVGRSGARGSVAVHGTDPYSFTARALALRVAELAGGAVVEPGARTPAEGLDPELTLARLGAALTWPADVMPGDGRRLRRRPDG